MKKSVTRLLTKMASWCLLVVLNYNYGVGIFTTANAQYLTSASSKSMTQSFYSVQKYADQISELQQVISVETEQAPLRDVLETIVSKANLGIAYNPELLSLKQPVTVNMQNVSIAQALESVLKDTKYEATISKTKEIVLRERPLFPTVEMKLEQEITGTVTDAQSGNTMPGVNVTVTGNPTVGTSTLRRS
ncbi:MAG: STN and carboxypeptidase regulatory-like domain-containing protein [Fodinibius sp.]|nr:STN and carboxypeptidase regulatory-like domain-containing protein [Fodinibius sp.]